MSAERTSARRWSRRDQYVAMAQGWIVADGDGRPLRIERLDSPEEDPTRRALPRFADDSEAAAYVQGRADAGDPRARKAVRLCVS